MRTPVALVALLLPCLSLLAQDKQRLTFEDTRKQIKWTDHVPAVAWAFDGKHVELIDGKARAWIDPVTGARSEPQKPPEPPASSAPPQHHVVLREGKLVLLDGGGRTVGRGRRDRRDSGADAGDGTVLAELKGKVREAHLAPGEAHASFVRDSNLVVFDLASRQEWAVTQDGGPKLCHGFLDWVYQEEVYGRGNFQGHWWSGKGDQLAFLSLDEAAVKDFTIVNHVPPGFLDRERAVLTEVTSYPKVGDPNPTARASVARVAGKKVVPVDLSGYPKDVIIARVEWTPDADRLLLTLQDRIQTTADLFAVDPRTGKGEVWIHEQSATWVNRPEGPQWQPDGSFLWLSERTGYQHVYHYARGGKLLAAITAGDWQVRAIERVDAQQGLLWFEGTKDGAIDRNVYRIGFDGKNLVRLTQGAGTHTVEFDHDATYFIDRWSAMDRPMTVRLCSGQDGKVVKELGQADKGDAAKYAFAEKQRVTIKARDGYELDGSVMLPTEFDASRKYPVLLPTYSGPDAPSVRDGWGHSTMQQFHCQQGFIVLQVNVRSASSRGQTHIGTCYRQLGVQELKDLEDAVDWVCQEHHGDPARVAIQGWSYGGFITAYALTHSQKFALGLAGAGVYDWRLYDSIYTERYMRTPDDNQAGYDATSVIKAAKNLHGHLVLVHGTMDDNVHEQNVMQLLWELEKAGKQNFELMLYPRSQHGLSPEVGPHEQQFEWRALQRLLDPNFKAE